MSNEEASSLSVIDIDQNIIVQEVPTGAEPEGVAIGKDGKVVYVTSEVGDLVHEIDAVGGHVTRDVVVGTRPRRFAATPDGKQLWVTTELSGEVFIIDLDTFMVGGKIEFLPPGMRKSDVTPVGLAMTKDGRTAYVTLGHAAHVAVVDVPTRAIQGYILVGKRSWGITLSRDEGKRFMSPTASATTSPSSMRRAVRRPSPFRSAACLGVWPSMTRARYFVLLLVGLCQLALGCGSLAIAQDAERQRVAIGYVEIAGDVRYEPIKAYERLVLKIRDHPFAGAQIGLDDAKVLARVLKTDFALERITVKSAADVATAVQQAMAARDIRFFIIDAPVAAFVPLAAAVRGATLCCSTSPRRTMRCAATCARRRSSTSFRASR